MMSYETIIDASAAENNNKGAGDKDVFLAWILCNHCVKRTRVCCHKSVTSACSGVKLRLQYLLLKSS